MWIAASGTIDTYEKLCRYMDEQISKAVLGETMSTTAASTGMGSNQANVQNDVRKELAERDAKLLCETIRRTLMVWLVEYNVPGARVPSLERNFDEPEDLSARADRDTKILTLGYEPTEQYILDTYGEGWVKKQAPAPAALPFGAPPMSGAQDATQFSEAVVSARA